MGGWANYGDREDMQDDTYRIMSQLIIQAIMAYRAKDASVFHSEVDALFLMLFPRLEKEKREEIEKRLSEASSALYLPEEDDERRGEIITSVVDDLRDIFKDLLGELDSEGLLYRARGDLDSVVTQGRDR